MLTKDKSRYLLRNAIADKMKKKKMQPKLHALVTSVVCSLQYDQSSKFMGDFYYQREN